MNPAQASIALVERDIKDLQDLAQHIARTPARQPTTIAPILAHMQQLCDDIQEELDRLAELRAESRKAYAQSQAQRWQ